MKFINQSKRNCHTNPSNFTVLKEKKRKKDSSTRMTSILCSSRAGNLLDLHGFEKESLQMKNLVIVLRKPRTDMNGKIAMASCFFSRCSLALGFHLFKILKNHSKTLHKQFCGIFLKLQSSILKLQMPGSYDER